MLNKAINVVITLLIESNDKLLIMRRTQYLQDKAKMQSYPRNRRTTCTVLLVKSIQ